jgi:uncharacterized protein YdaU (DUF1376 family)
MSKVDVFMPIYIGDYLKDTTFLTTEQHGAYLLMLFACWQHGSIPNDDHVVCRVTGLSTDAWSNAKSILLAYFKHNEAKIWHSRIDRELLAARDRKQRYSQRGKAGSAARWGKEENASSNATSIKQAMLEQCPSPSPSPSHIKEEERRVRARSFIPPTVADVQEYVKIRQAQGKPSIDPETFIAFYESKGWVVGKTKMKCWKSAIQTWEKREVNNQAKPALRKIQEVKSC